MRLFIAEKPSLGRAIAENLGQGTNKDGYIECNGGADIVTWCFGHILRLYRPDEYGENYKSWSMKDLPILPNPWKKAVSNDAKKQFKIIKELIGKAEYIVNAGDPDREGQLLIDEVLEYCHNKKPVKRILLNALDNKSVLSALETIRGNEEFAGLFDSALARSYADWLVGMNLSRAYTLRNRSAGYNFVVHVGRVQTPTLALVVRREKEIEKFKPTTHYVVHVTWKHDAGLIPTTWKMPEDMEGLDGEGRLLDQTIAEGILSKMQLIANQGDGAVVQSVEEKTKQEGQRLPYSLSSLQVEAGKKYGYSPQQVLDTMQSLYEKKWTTYPRSDCNYLPTNQLEDCEKILANLRETGDAPFTKSVQGADLETVSRAWNDNKITAHHALIPTGVKADMNAMTEIEKNLYLMVAKAYLAQFYPIHTYHAKRVVIACGDEEFVGTGKTILQMGWKGLYQKDSSDQSAEEENEANENTVLPELDEGSLVAFEAGSVKEKTTKPPARFTEATLLQAMKDIYKYVKYKELAAQLKECKGLGTEATRADIIEKLKKAQFIETKKKKLVPTESGCKTIAMLPDTLTYPDTTALWEAALDKMVLGEVQFDAFLSGQVDSLKSMIQDAQNKPVEQNKDLPVCPTCGKVMMRRKGKYGFFWGCSGYPDCETRARDVDGKPDFTPRAQASTAKCPVCGKNLRQIQGKFGTFWSCEDRDKCKAHFPDHENKPVIVRCPSCEKGFLNRAESKKKKGSYYWYCTDHCGGNLIWDNDGLPDLPMLQEDPTQSL